MSTDIFNWLYFINVWSLEDVVSLINMAWREGMSSHISRILIPYEVSDWLTCSYMYTHVLGRSFSIFHMDSLLLFEHCIETHE